MQAEDAQAAAAEGKQEPATPSKHEQHADAETAQSPAPRVVPQAGLTRTNKRRRSLAGEDELLSDHNLAEKAVQELKDDDQEPSKLSKGPPGHLDYRWRTQTMCEDYVNMVADLMYPKLQFGPFGYDAEQQQYPMERIPALGYLLSPLRKPTVIEKWSPYEVSLFESAIMLYGKNFHMIQQIVNTKTANEVIEFYYMWKQTSHYKYWKKVYVPEQLEEEDA